MEKKDFAMRLKDLRKDKGYNTQDAFADALRERTEKRDKTGDPLMTIKKWESETNKAFPSFQYLEDLCELLDCDADYLLGRQNKPRKDIEIASDSTGLSYAAIKKIASYSPINKEILNNMISEREVFTRLLSGIQSGINISFQNFAQRRKQINARDRKEINTIDDLENMDHYRLLKECESYIEKSGCMVDTLHAMLNLRIKNAKLKAADVYSKENQ